MSQPWDSLPGWAQQLGTLIGAGGGSVVVLKVIERVFKRDDREAADRVTISTELRQDIRDLKADVERLESQLEVMRAENTRLNVRLARAETREAWTRNRYHRLTNWLQTEPSISPPAWLFEEIPRAESEQPSEGPS